MKRGYVSSDLKKTISHINDERNHRPAEVYLEIKIQVYLLLYAPFLTNLRMNSHKLKVKYKKRNHDQHNATVMKGNVEIPRLKLCCRPGKQSI